MNILMTFGYSIKMSNEKIINKAKIDMKRKKYEQDYISVNLVSDFLLFFVDKFAYSENFHGIHNADFIS